MIPRRSDRQELIETCGSKDMMDLRRESVFFPPNHRHGDGMDWAVFATKGETFVSWCDDGGAVNWEVHDSWNEAAEHQLAGMLILYEEFHAEDMEREDLAVVVSRNTDGDGRIVGWSFSLDSDGGNHGYDETYGDY